MQSLLAGLDFSCLAMFIKMDLTFMNYYNGDGTLCTNLKDCPNATYPLMLFQLLPKGILGLVLAGLLAAMMSSVSATFNSASTLVTMDFVKQLRPDISSQGLVRVGQIVTLILVVLAVLWIPFIDKVATSLWEYLQKALAYICPPVAATFIMGMFWKRSNANGAFYGLIVGFFLAIWMVICGVMDPGPEAGRGRDEEAGGPARKDDVRDRAGEQAPLGAPRQGRQGGVVPRPRARELRERQEGATGGQGQDPHHRRGVQKSGVGAGSVGAAVRQSQGRA